MATIELKADITGNVWKILKAVGDAVQEEEDVLIMESMKMEIPVEAMFAGKVSKIHCSVGDLVDQDQLLVVLA